MTACFSLVFAVVAFASADHVGISSDVDYDVVIYGSTPAGIAAAVVAGNHGLRVGLFEPLKMIGGMGAAGNLALNDGGVGAEKTGVALNFTLLNGQHYYPGVAGKQVTHPESFVAESSFYTMLRDANVHTVKLDCRLLSAKTAKDGNNAPSYIASISLHCEPDPVTATVFIDASYDGDVMVAAGDVDYTWGREAKSTYNESLAGVRTPGFSGVSGPQHVDALHDNGTLLKYVQNISELGAPGTADDALMAFQHRLCITSNASNRLTWAKPEGYVADDFLLHLRALQANRNTSLMSLGSHPPGLPDSINKYCTCCGISVASSDQPNLNKGWANASWERKQQIIADHTYFELGSYYFLANDPRVPQSVRTRYSEFGLCADEFVDFGNVPPQLYVRISNRLVGDYVMTQNNMYPQSKNDSIAVADWSLDEHMTNKFAVPVGNGRFEVQLEGNFWPSVGPNGNWYDTPYGIMVPKRGTGANLLVPVAVSSSAVAFSSTRIENWYMSVGSAAGGAAKQVVDGDADTVQDVDVAKLQALLSGMTPPQRIHGPPQHPTPPPTPPVKRALYFNVSGAGSAEWNGQYSLTAQTYDGQRIYERVDKDCPNGGTCSLYSYGGVWRLASVGHELFYTADGPSAERGGAQPPLTGWMVDNGTAPAPSLTAGPYMRT